MSTTAVTFNVIDQSQGNFAKSGGNLHAYFQQRITDLKQLSQDLHSGNLTAAQQDFNAIQTLAHSGPFGGNAFQISERQQDFATIGQALQSGDLNGALQALAQLKSTFTRSRNVTQPPAVIVNLGSGPSSSGASSGSGSTSHVASPGPTATEPEIIVNLGNATPGEQITINLSSTANGGEHVGISVANSANQSPEQITFNLAKNSNEQIVLNLFNSSSPSAAQSSGLNVTA